MRIWNQLENGLNVREWGPTETGKTGTLVLRYRFDQPIKTCSLRTTFKVWRDDDELLIAISHDDRNYTLLTNATNGSFIDLTPHTQGHKVVYVRFQAKGTQLNTHITTPSLLRTTPDFEYTRAPNVYEFKATTED